MAISPRPGLTLPMYHYIPLINTRLGTTFSERSFRVKHGKDPLNYDLPFYGNNEPTKPVGNKNSQKYPETMSTMMDQQQQEQGFLEQILSDPNFPYLLPIILIVSLAVIVVPLSGWLFTGFLTNNYAFIDNIKNSNKTV